MSMVAMLGTPPSLKLTRGNFLLWKTLVFPPLWSAQVFDLLDGTEVVPEKTLEIEDAEKKKSTVPNPAYTAWVSRDQTVLGWVLQTLSLEVTAHVVGLETSAAMWAVIINMFSSASRTRINHL
jgi:hypothetical protein